jgi:hypothetical protein
LFAKPAEAISSTSKIKTESLEEQEDMGEEVRRNESMVIC